jgi:hypothetical protein
MKIPTKISSFLIVLGLFGSSFILLQDTESLRLNEKISNHIALWAGVAAFISAAYVIASYLQTNYAFILSQRPHLRIRVENVMARISEQDHTLVHMTRILYENLTINPFEDLTIKVKVHNSKTVADISDLFSPKMFMAGHDARQRNFCTRTEILARGFEIESQFVASDPPKLSISYEFTFSQEVQQINIQQYAWDVTRKEWTIV